MRFAHVSLKFISVEFKTDRIFFQLKTMMENKQGFYFYSVSQIIEWVSILFSIPHR